MPSEKLVCHHPDPLPTNFTNFADFADFASGIKYPTKNGLKALRGGSIMQGLQQVPRTFKCYIEERDPGIPNLVRRLEYDLRFKS